MNIKNLLSQNLARKIFLSMTVVTLFSYVSLEMNAAVQAETIAKAPRTTENLGLTTYKDTVSYIDIALNKTIDNLTVGLSDSLYVTVYPSNTTKKDVVWTSSNSKVVKVSDGYVTAVSAGIATITATAGGRSVSCVVTVINPISVTLVSLSKTTDTLTVGYSDSLYATVYPSNAADRNIIWTTSNSSVATVSLGCVTAVDEGTATITASAGGKTASCVVTVSSSNSVASISLNKTTDSLAIGHSDSLYATVRPYQDVTWTSSNPDVVKVSDGYVTAVGAGAATITAAAGGKTASCIVKVESSISVALILLNKTADTLTVGGGDTLYASVYPSNTAGKGVVWTSSNPNIVKVSSIGNITAVSAGKATITATAGSVAASCVITVKDLVLVTSISLNKTKDTLIELHTDSLYATVCPDDATIKDVIWTSSNPDVVTVSNGHIIAISDGSATITATAGSKSDSCIVTVSAFNPVLVKFIYLNITTTTLRIEDIISLYATVYPRDATNRSVTWTTSNPNVAKVSSSGYVTAVDVGTTTITATAEGKTATCSITVLK